MALMNMYGLSETTGSTTIHYVDGMSLDHAGQQIKGSHIKIADKDENGVGEIRIYGISLCRNIQLAKQRIWVLKL